MEEELKLKYNELLPRYKKGLEYLESNPDDSSAKTALKKIEKEISNVLKSLGDGISQDEIENGFKIEEKPKETDEIIEKETKTMTVKKTKKVAVPIVQDNNVIDTPSGAITLTPDIVKKTLVNGQGNVTDSEVAMFIGMCKANRLNPFNKEAYLIKYSNSTPATMVTSKDVFFRRAIENPDYDGMESGIYVMDAKGEIKKRDGEIYVKGEQVIGAWCNVYRKSWSHPITDNVNFEERAQKKSTGELNTNWKTKPAMMIKKVAEASALRKAFTDNLKNMYIIEEMQSEDNTQDREQPQDIL